MPGGESDHMKIADRAERLQRLLPFLRVYVRAPARLHLVDSFQGQGQQHCQVFETVLDCVDSKGGVAGLSQNGGG